MDGKSGKGGAVAGVSKVKNPIVLARKVMDETEHVMLIGEGAEKFAKEVGVELVDPSYFYSEKNLHVSPLSTPIIMIETSVSAFFKLYQKG